MSISSISSVVTYGSSSARHEKSAAQNGQLPPPEGGLKTFDPSQATHLNVVATPLAPDFMMTVLEVQSMPPDGEEDSPCYQPYAEIKVGDEIVATVSNAGGLSMRMNMAGEIPFGGADEAGLTGPALAQFRADRIAQALGGSVFKSDTAMTQEEFEAQLPQKLSALYDAMTAALGYDGRNVRVKA
jgi:hypothetical protein